MFGGISAQQASIRRRNAPHVVFPQDIDKHDANEKVSLKWKNKPEPQLASTITSLSIFFLWVGGVFAVGFLVSLITCDAFESNKAEKCAISYPLVPLPSLGTENTQETKKALPILPKLIDSVRKGNFENSKIWKGFWKTMALDNEGNAIKRNIDITAIVYSDTFSGQNGEIALPLTGLYYENSINELIIIDDSNNFASNLYWQKLTLFGKYSIKNTLSGKANAGDFGNRQIVDLATLEKWFENKPSNDKLNIIQSENVGKWKGFELGSRLGYKPSKIESKIMRERSRQEIHSKVGNMGIDAGDDILHSTLKTNDIDLILLLDTKHALPLNDKWIAEALALFDKYPNMQVLGGFSGIIKHGTTFGDISFENRKKVKFESSKVEYRDDHWDAISQHTKWREKSAKEESIGSKKMKAYMYDKIVNLRQTYLKFIDYHSSKINKDGKYDDEFSQARNELKLFLDELEKMSDEIKQVTEKKHKISFNKLESHNGKKDKKDEKDKKEQLLSLYPELMLIPYETKIKYLLNRIDEASGKKEIGQKIDWIPFMFITGVRMGPIFVRRDWWFDKLLPHISEMSNNNKNNNGISMMQDWMDVEMSLYTWALGGYVGLYNAQGFKYDRNDFDKEIFRNHQLDMDFNYYHDSHKLSNYFDNSNENNDWNVWNVTKLIQLNEDDQFINDYETFDHMRLRTGFDESCKNTAHPIKLQTARQILTLLAQIEDIFDPNTIKNA